MEEFCLEQRLAWTPNGGLLPLKCVVHWKFTNEECWWRSEKGVEGKIRLIYLGGQRGLAFPNQAGIINCWAQFREQVMFMLLT
jgi:hypothetical protein